MKRRFYLPLILLLSFAVNLRAQIERLSPKSFERSFQLDESRRQRISPPDLTAVHRADEANPTNRFAYPVKVDLSWADGTWYDLPSGGRMWQLSLESSQALGLAVFYDEFYLPPGATLHMYTPDKAEVIGAYTSRVNPANGKFWTGFTRGERAILEYFEPPGQRDQGRLHIFRIDYAYQKDNFNAALRSASQMELGFGTSDGCHNNINCPLGQEFQTAKKAVCRILLVFEEGTGYCTGNLINNVREDDRPYVLSAFHCQDGFTPLFDFWRFDFNYESSDCNNPASEPNYQSMLGCVERAGRQENDFLLLELNDAVPANYDVHFLGWNRANTPPTDATMIHHPKGDIKKIATTDQSIQIFNGSIQWSNEVVTPAGNHFEVRWTDGAFAIGSSGAALLDQNQRVVGQLHGGNNACDNSQAWYGRLARSWEGGGTAATRLKDWLDPDNTGAIMLDGKANENRAGVELSGVVLTDAGDPIPGVQVQILGAGGLALATFTDAQGTYQFTNIPTGDAYQVNPAKSGAAINGVSVLDLIQVQKHILNIEPLTSPYQQLAADVNASSSITTLDLILIRKVILNLDTAFENVLAWTFLPADAVFIDNNDAFQGLSTGTFSFTIPMDQTEGIIFDIIGIKAGDVNNSADLGK
jgi:hypothetical protein